MATITVVTTSYVDVPDNGNADPEAIVRDALATADAIYMVEVTRTGVLLDR